MGLLSGHRALLADAKFAQSAHGSAKPPKTAPFLAAADRWEPFLQDTSVWNGFSRPRGPMKIHYFKRLRPPKKADDFPPAQSVVASVPCVDRLRFGFHRAMRKHGVIIPPPTMPRAEEACNASAYSSP